MTKAWTAFQLHFYRTIVDAISDEKWSKTYTILPRVCPDFGLTRIWTKVTPHSSYIELIMTCRIVFLVLKFKEDVPIKMLTNQTWNSRVGWFLLCDGAETETEAGIWIWPMELASGLWSLDPTFISGLPPPMSSASGLQPGSSAGASIKPAVFSRLYNTKASALKADASIHSLWIYDCSFFSMVQDVCQAFSLPATCPPDQSEVS